MTGDRGLSQAGAADQRHEAANGGDVVEVVAQVHLDGFTAGALDCRNSYRSKLLWRICRNIRSLVPDTLSLKRYAGRIRNFSLCSTAYRLRIHYHTLGWRSRSDRFGCD